MAALTLNSSPQVPLSFSASPGSRTEDHATSPEIRKQIADNLIAMSMSQIVPTQLAAQLDLTANDTSRDGIGAKSDTHTGSTSTITIPQYNNGSSSSSSVNGTAMLGDASVRGPSNGRSGSLSSHDVSPHLQPALPGVNELSGITQKSVETDFDMDDSAGGLLHSHMNAPVRLNRGPATAPRTARNPTSTIAFAPDNSGFMSPVALDHVAPQPRGSYQRLHHQSPAGYADLEALDDEDEATMHKLSPSHRNAVKANYPTPTKMWGHKQASLSQGSPGALRSLEEVAYSPPRTKPRLPQRVTDIMNSPAAIKTEDVYGPRSGHTHRSITEMVDDEERNAAVVQVKHGKLLFDDSADLPPAPPSVHRSAVTNSPFRPKRASETVPVAAPEVQPAPPPTVAAAIDEVTREIKQTPQTGHTMSRVASVSNLEADMFSPFSRFVNAALAATSPVVASASPELQHPAQSTTAPAEADGVRRSRREKKRARRPDYEELDGDSELWDDVEHVPYRDARGSGASPNGLSPAYPTDADEYSEAYEEARPYHGGRRRSDLYDNSPQDYDYDYDDAPSHQAGYSGKGRRNSSAGPAHGDDMPGRNSGRGKKGAAAAPQPNTRRRAAPKAAGGASGRIYAAKQVSQGAPGTSPITLAAALDPEPIRHQTTCHRCTSSHPENVRVYCVACPACWCAACARRAVQMFGLTTFDDGCPKCKRLCCCIPFSGNVVSVHDMSPVIAQLLAGNVADKGAAVVNKKDKAKVVEVPYPKQVVTDVGLMQEGSCFCVLPLHCRNCRLRPTCSAIGVEPVRIAGEVENPDVRRRRAEKLSMPGLEAIPDYLPVTDLELGSGGMSATHQRLEYQYLCSEKDAWVIINDFLQGGESRRKRIAKRIADACGGEPEAEPEPEACDVPEAEAEENPPPRKRARNDSSNSPTEAVQDAAVTATSQSSRSRRTAR